ncbi:MAG TPA: type VI secretion system ImpA family N-terminal domain-containing protein [Candidatus Binatia bacterium]|nr:type VI secretion system ImpA family N-terminal domain-containing protein [Candidatus Binatia bacterium]
MSLDAYLSPVSEEKPAGIDLDETGFLFTLDAMVGWADGAPHSLAEWRQIDEKVHEGLQQSRDLRLAVLSAVSLLNVEGLSGFARGIHFLRRYLEASWEYTYPPVDEDGAADARRNTLLNLTSYPRVLRPLHRCTLISQPGIGAFSAFDVDVAEGKAEWPADETREAPSSGAVGAAFEGAGEATIRELFTTADQLLEDLHGLARAFDQRASETGSPPLDRLLTLITRIRTIAKDRLPEEPQPVEEHALHNGNGAVPGEPIMVAAGPPGAVRTRKDAIAAMERVIRYFAESEPTSPVPLLLERAIRLADADFVTIVEDLAPDALVQARLLRGRQQDS